MNSLTTGSVSATDITVPTVEGASATSLAQSSIEVRFDLLRELQHGLKDQPQDLQVITLMRACIEEGIHEGKRLTGILHRLGFNRRYVGMQLDLHTGNDPARHWWYKDDTGRYHLLDQPNA